MEATQSITSMPTGHCHGAIVRNGQVPHRVLFTKENMPWFQYEEYMPTIGKGERCPSLGK